MTPLVSIGMPVFNCARTVGSSIRSILAQTYENWELLVPDDGSTDSTLEVISSFGDPRIIVGSDGLHKSLSARLNECIQGARGTYFARMDGDDVAYPERLERQVRFLSDHPEVDLVGASVLVFGRDGCVLGKRTPPTEHAAIVRQPLANFPMAHPTWLGKLEWFRRFLYDPKAPRTEDYDLMLRAYQVSRFANVPEILLGYREERLSLKKNLESRTWALRHVAKNEKGARGLARWCYAAGLMAPRAALEAVALLTGLNHYLLRHRARPAEAAEIQKWEQVWKSVVDKPSAKAVEQMT